MTEWVPKEWQFGGHLKWGKRRYMVMELLLNPAKQEEVAA
jgi:hypothetical protein